MNNNKTYKTESNNNINMHPSDPKGLPDESLHKERVSIFIDGSNLYHSLKEIKEKIDFEKLIKNLVGDRELVKVFYYTANLNIKEDEKRYWEHQRFLGELQKIPKFNVVLCNLKRIKQKDGSFEYVIKGDDARLIHDFIVGSYENLYDTAIIVSGDEDFEPMIKTAQKKGKKVGNVYFRSSSSSTLRKSCDFSVCINNNIEKFRLEKKKDLALPKGHTRSIIKDINNNKYINFTIKRKSKK
jgi:uncharacterized LabA/DUF88 family protein